MQFFFYCLQYTIIKLNPSLFKTFWVGIVIWLDLYYLDNIALNPIGGIVSTRINHPQAFKSRAIHFTRQTATWLIFRIFSPPHMTHICLFSEQSENYKLLYCGEGFKGFHSKAEAVERVNTWKAHTFSKQLFRDAIVLIMFINFAHGKHYSTS